MSKELVQAKLTSIYGKSTFRTNNDSKLNLKHDNSGDCMIVEKTQTHAIHTKGHAVSSFLKAEGEGRTSGNTLGTKRVHMEINSPRVSNPKSPLSNEEVNLDTRGSGFVTARAKLVLYFTTITTSSLFFNPLNIYQIFFAYFA